MHFENLAKIKLQLQKGDNSCLEILFKQEADFCIKNLVRTTNCPLEEAEDIFIEAVMDFRQRVISEKLIEVNDMRNYVYTTCKNMWFNRLKQKTSREKKYDNISNFLHEEYENDPITTLEDLEEEQDQLMLSKKSFDQLSEQCQDIIYFYYVEGYQMKDIAKVMNLANANVVKVMKHRCFRKLLSFAKDFYHKSSNEPK